MRGNTAFERSMDHCGPRLDAAEASWPAAHPQSLGVRQKMRIGIGVLER